MQQRLSGLLMELIFFLSVTALLLCAVYFYCFRMPGKSFHGDLPALSEEMQALSTRLNEHVRVLSEEIGERHYKKMDALNRAADYIETQFQSFRYVPKSQPVNGKVFRNIVVDLYGKQYRDNIIVIGAHYDSVWMTPGADDNASGVAALLEIARALAGKQLPITIRFVAFVNEEEPFFGGSDMGSGFSAKRSNEQNENIIGMFSLEMVGYYDDAPRSQDYPRPLRYFYPDRGNFIAFVSNLVSRKFLTTAVSAFREHAKFPSEGLAAPEMIVPDIRRSDNVSYWAYGYPAVMVTDTSNYRNWNYHNIGDTRQTLDYDRMARVVSGLTDMIEALAH